MQFGLLAFLFGIALFAASRTALSPERGDSPGWWLLVLAIAVLHAAAGFRVIGGAPVSQGNRVAAVAESAVASLVATGVCVLVAVLLASRIEVDVPPVAALAIAGATVLTAPVIMAGADWRSRLRQFGMLRFGRE